MWVRLRKDLRELSVPWLQALGGLLLATWSSQSSVVALVGFTSLCCYLAVRPMGAEIEQGTMPRLLSQPIARSRLWWEKMLVVALLILAAGALLSGARALTGSGLEDVGLWWLLAWAALASGPGLVLVLRDNLMATCAAVAILGALYGFAAWLAAVMENTIWSELGARWILFPYAAAMAVWSHHKFRNFEPTSASIPTSRSIATAGLFGTPTLHHLASQRPRLERLRHLMWKEIQAQRSSLLLVAVVMLGWIALWLIGPVGTEDRSSRATDLLMVAKLSLIYLSSLVVPLLIGANAVAAERRLGVLNWQLALPVSIKTQWRVKLAVALGMWLLVTTTGFLGVSKLVALGEVPSQLAWLPLTSLFSSTAIVCPLACLILGIYGSRHTSSPFRAIGHALVAGIAAYYVWRLAFFSLLLRTTWQTGFGWLPTPSVNILYLVTCMLLTWMLWRPSQEEWLAGRQLIRTGGLALVALLLFSHQLYVFAQTSRQLDREIAYDNKKLELALDRDAEEILNLDQDFDSYAAGILPIHMLWERYSNHDAASTKSSIDLDDGSVTQPLSDDPSPQKKATTPAMIMVARHDGVQLGHGTFSRQFWEPFFYSVLWPAGAENPFRPARAWYRVERSSWKRHSLAPLLGRQQRLEKLDVRMRQVITLAAIDILQGWVGGRPDSDWEYLTPWIEQGPLRDLAADTAATSEVHLPKKRRCP